MQTIFYFNNITIYSRFELLTNKIKEYYIYGPNHKLTKSITYFLA